MQMQLSSDVRIPDGLLAAMTLLREKPHLGVSSRNPALYQGPTVCNSTTALGLRGQAELNRVWPRYTAKERDTESGNDYFGARYLSSNAARFLSPDWSDVPMAVPYGDLENPQSLNQYAYVNNNPLSMVDDDGHDGAVPAGKCGFLCWLVRMFSGGGNSGGSPPPPPAPPAPPAPPNAPNLVPPASSGWINNQAFANYMDSHYPNTKGNGQCATACRQGMEAGGLNTAGHPIDAKNYGPFLLQHGYHTVPGASYFGNEQVGDIAVFQPAPGHSQSGHIEMYDGNGWVSDFQQKNFSPYHGFKPPTLNFKIYRH